MSKNTQQAVRFGTDGVRGPAGRWPLTRAGAHLIGRAIAAWCGRGSVVIGEDTRESSPDLSDALASGLVAGGATALDAGILPTAAVSCAVVDESAAAGVMITASHNPWADNGIKVLTAAGTKPSDADIARLEALFDDPPAPGGGRRAMLHDPARAWRESLPEVDLRGVRILVDCANGAAARHTPHILSRLGAEVVRRGCAPSGRNINDGVGALHPPSDLQGCDLALCFDGDADRLAVVTASHGLLDGDDLLWIFSQDLPGPVVGTIMTNGGLERALGGRLLRAQVGDQNVAALMRQHGALVGAETSGHVLFADGPPTGDGLYAALRLLQGADGSPRLLFPLAGWRRLPTVQRNIRYEGARRPLEALQAPLQAQEDGHRVIIRYSGTEPVLRILVEGDQAARWVVNIANEFLSLG